MELIVKKLEDKMYFSFIGELDDANSHDIREKIDNVLCSNSYRAVVFDLERLTFMDSTGIGILIGRYKKLKREGIAIYISRPNKQVDKILMTTGMYQIMKKIS